MYYILLGVSIILAVVKSSLYNNYAKSENPDSGGIFAFNAISYGSALVVSLFFGQNGILSPSTLICAFFYAVIVCSLQGLSVYAMKIGPMSITSLIILYGMIIPTVSGPIFWNESFGIMQFLGVVLMLFSMWLLSKGETAKKSIEKKWFLIVAIVFFLSGFAGVIEKIHQTSDGKNEKAIFLLIAYLIMSLISVCGKFILSRNQKKITSIKNLALNGIISGFVIGCYALTNLTLAGNLDSMIYYPVANGGALILTVLVSIIVFHEKCTKKQIIGIISGLIAVILISL